MSVMKPKEREMAILNGEKVDRVPVWDINGINAAHVYGIQWKDIRTDSKQCVELMRKWGRECGTDVLSGPCMETNAPFFDLGLKYKMVDDNYSNMMSNYYNDPEDIDTKTFYDPSNPKECPLLWEYMFGSIKLMGETEKDHLNHAFSWGIMTTAGAFRGVEQLLTDFMLEPELAQKVMNKVTEFVDGVIRAALDFGCDCTFIADPSASGTLISEEMFEEFCEPYLKKTFAGWKKDFQCNNYLHICGDTLPVIEGIKSVQPDVFSFDYMNDISEMRKAIGNKFVMAGNLNPMEVVWLGNPASIEQAAKAAIEKAEGDRFILATGCEVPRDTPMENLRAIAAAADKYGQY